MFDAIAADGAADFAAWMPHAKGTMEPDAAAGGACVAVAWLQPAIMIRATPTAANLLNPSRHLRLEAIGTSLTRPERACSRGRERSGRS
jgi:hypothetical protein